MRHRLSVVVVTHNSRAEVAAALPELTLEEGDELIVVDNASVDGTIDLVRETAPEARIVQTGHNAGFAGAANAGALAATRELLVFLNPDATPAPGFADAIRDSRCDAWMGLVTADGGRSVNSGGGVLHFTGIAWAGQVAQREPAFLSGACLAVPRDMFERLGGFSEAYFLYHEDVDLSLRLRLSGARLGVEPAAVVDHDYEFAKGAAKWRYLERNRWATLIRCYPGRLLALLAPALVATELALLVVAATGGWLPQKLAATGETVRALPRLLHERRAVQATRTISAREFADWLTPDLDSPFLGRAGQLKALRWALRTYWRLVLRAL